MSIAKIKNVADMKTIVTKAIQMGAADGRVIVDHLASKLS